jgi:isoleucyl-tRNA synthetase
VTESYRRLRNTLRFLLANLSDFDPLENAVPFGEMLELDQYALLMARQVQEKWRANCTPVMPSTMPCRKW